MISNYCVTKGVSILLEEEALRRGVTKQAYQPSVVAAASAVIVLRWLLARCLGFVSVFCEVELVLVIYRSYVGLCGDSFCLEEAKDRATVNLKLLSFHFILGRCKKVVQVSIVILFIPPITTRSFWSRYYHRNIAIQTQCQHTS